MCRQLKVPAKCNETILQKFMKKWGAYLKGKQCFWDWSEADETVWEIRLSLEERLKDQDKDLQKISPWQNYLNFPVKEIS